ncbi:MAG: choice-of-anchor D domain-containing protein, partial [Acidobacteriaceae bacterium]|nr:choice-of-anchor D domain-containing protein [Acidobacteriaceae bacterium]
IPQADYDLYLAAVPSQQDTLLFAGTEDIYKCSLANNCAWRNTTNAAGCASAGVAWAQHAVDATFGSQGLVFFGNDGGLWRTTDAVNQQQPTCSADDAAHYQNLNGGLGSLAEVENLANDANNPLNMMASLGSLGTAAATASVTGAWPQVLDSEGNYAAIDPAVEANWYATAMFGVSVDRCTEGSGCNQAGFLPAIGSSQVGGDGDQQTIPAPWILDPQDTANVILGTCRVWRGPGTGGSAWTSASLLSGMLDGIPGPFCDGNAEIRSLAASGRATDVAGTPEQIYAGMAGLFDGGATVPGHIFTASVTNSSDATTPWVDLFHRPVANGGSANDQFNPGGFDISSVYVDPHDPTGQTVYATVQGFTGNQVVAAKVYGSTNGGSVWENLTTNLPNAPANSIVIDPNDANTAYLAMDTGVYITRNITSCQNPAIHCWSVFGTSLPNAPVIQLTTENEGSTSVLRAATYGRGVWEIPLVTAGAAMTTAQANPASLSFPTQQVETQSASQTVAVINTGKITLNVSQVSIIGDFAETDDCAGAAVLPGDACTVNVTFTPSQTGQRTGSVAVYGNISGGATSGQIAVQLSGTGAPGPAIVLTPASLSFPQTLLGQTAAAQNITVSNTGGVPISLTSEGANGAFSITANTCGSSLSPNVGCTLSIAFAPTASGKQTGTLTVVDSVGTQTAQLSGIGETPATDSLAPLNLVFGPQTIGTSSQTQQVTLTNNGDQSLDLIAIQVNGDFNAVNQCGTSLAGHSTCAIVVNFVPTQVGAETGTLFVGDALRGQTVTLSGTGLAPAGISVAPAAVNFGSYGINQTSRPQMVTLTNNGGIPLSSVSFAATGDFGAQASSSGGCGTTLAIGASCQIGVTFTPGQAGPRTGTMTVSAAQLKAPLTVSLSGSGMDFALQVSGSSSAVITSGQTATFMISILPVNGSTGTVSLACTGAPQNSACTVNPQKVTLTGQNTASATVTIATRQSSSSAAVKENLRPPFSSFALALVIPIGFVVRRRRWTDSPKTKNRVHRLFRPYGRLVLIGVCGWLIVLSGCNLSVKPGGQSSTGTNPSGSQGNPTPSGVYTLTVTGAAPGLSHTAAVQLTVE